MFPVFRPDYYPESGFFRIFFRISEINQNFKFYHLLNHISKNFCSPVFPDFSGVFRIFPQIYKIYHFLFSHILDHISEKKWEKSMLSCHEVGLKHISESGWKIIFFFRRNSVRKQKISWKVANQMEKKKLTTKKVLTKPSTISDII